MHYVNGEENGMTWVRLGYGHLVPGQALPFDLFDEQGRTLLSHGYVLQSEEQLERLIERGGFFHANLDETVASTAPLVRLSIQQQMAELAQAFYSLFETAAETDILDCGAIEAIAQRIQECCLRDADPALACIQLQQMGCYSLRHSFNTAVLTEILLARLDCPEARRRQAIAGALTMNVAMRRLQDTLYHQETPLTPEQKREIVTHPSATVRMLQASGVEPSVWLDVVEHHHEMIDGSGYVKRLSGTSLSIESQVVSLADRYCATISERAYRPGTLPSLAAKDLLSRQAATIDPTLASVFLKEVGIYPPGTVVSLANGELAVVVRRTLNPAQPVVRSLRAPSGVRYPVPPKRLTSKPVYGIQEVLPHDHIRGFDLTTLWPALELDVDEDMAEG